MPSDGFFAISFDSLFKWGITITIIFKLLYLIWLSLSVNSSYCFMLNMRSCRLAWIWWACHILANLPLYWGQWHIFQEDQTVIHLFSFPVAFIILYVLSFVALYFCPFERHSPIWLPSADEIIGFLIFSESFSYCLLASIDFPISLVDYFPAKSQVLKELHQSVSWSSNCISIGSTSLVAEAPRWVDAHAVVPLSLSECSL